MINIEQFKEFPDAVGALTLKTVDIAIVEVQERGVGIICYVIMENNNLIHKIREEFPNYFQVNDISGFPTFWVCKSADEIKLELQNCFN